MSNYSILMTIPFLVAVIVAAPATTASDTLPAPTTAPPAPVPAATNSSTATAYDMLDQYKLARGILPDGVTGYVLRPDGSFEVYLPADCYLRAGDMKVRYSSVIKGNLQSQLISDLQGMHVKELFLWIAVTKVDASDDSDLHFIAGAISKSLPMDKFSNSPQCN